MTPDRADVADAITIEWLSGTTSAAALAAPLILALLLGCVFGVLNLDAVTISVGGGAVLAGAAFAWTRWSAAATVSLALTGIDFAAATGGERTFSRLLVAILTASGLFAASRAAALAPLLEQDAHVDRRVLSQVAGRSLLPGAATLLLGAMAGVVGDVAPHDRWQVGLGVGAMAVLVLTALVLSGRERGPVSTQPDVQPQHGVFLPRPSPARDAQAPMPNGDLFPT